MELNTMEGFCQSGQLGRNHVASQEPANSTFLAVPGSTPSSFLPQIWPSDGSISLQYSELALTFWPCSTRSPRMHYP